MSKKPKQIRPSLKLMVLTPDALVARAKAVKTGITDNPVYPHPPVDAATLGGAIDAYLAALAEALDSKKARAERDKRRVDLVRMLRQIAHYVEANCNDDMPTFLSSGFEPVLGRTASQTASAAVITGVEQGANSGQLLVYIKALPKARVYDIKYAAAADGSAGASTTLTVGTVRSAVSIDGLTPGTTYTFHVRAFGKSGFTDWSDPVSRMCI